MGALEARVAESFKEEWEAHCDMQVKMANTMRPFLTLKSFPKVTLIQRGMSGG